MRCLVGLLYGTTLGFKDGQREAHGVFSGAGSTAIRASAQVYDGVACGRPWQQPSPREMDMMCMHCMKLFASDPIVS